MANAFKNYFLKNANTTSQNVFSAGAGVQATVIGMTIANITNAPITANVTITSNGTSYFMVKSAIIASGGALVPIGGDQKVVLQASDVLYVVNSASSSGDCFASLLEIA